MKQVTFIVEIVLGKNSVDDLVILRSPGNGSVLDYQNGLSSGLGKLSQLVEDYRSFAPHEEVSA